MKILVIFAIFASVSAHAQKGGTYFSTKNLGKKFNHMDVKYSGGNALDRSYQDLTKRKFPVQKKTSQGSENTQKKANAGQVLFNLLKN